MTRSVLVAESDATELELIATVLARDGFHVLRALARDDAEAIFAASEVTLVIAASDVSGRGGGALLCSEVKKLRPETKFVLLHPSGNDVDAREVLLKRTGCDAVLPSPFRYDALKRVLAEWGYAVPARPTVVSVSFAVPPPDVASLVAPPEPPPAAAAPLAALEVAPVAVPIPIPVVFPETPAPALVEYAGDAVADTPASDPLAALPPVAAEPPPLPEPLLTAPEGDLSQDPGLQGDWLLAPPPEGASRDGFAGLDFHSIIHDAAEASLDDTPAAPVDLPPPPPPEADERSARVAKGASSWSPSSPPPALPASEAPEPAPRKPIASEPPAPEPVALASITPASVTRPPPPPPPEALDEPPALPFEAIVQRTPVGSEPRTTLPPSIPPEGDLATTPLPRLLFELYGGTYCGTLRLSRRGVERAIDVWNGFPVAVTVTPTEADDDLASLLRDHGRITSEQYDDARRRAAGREAQLLVALGIIDERDLLDAIREQTELRLAASFSWRDGTYKITPTKAPPDSVVLSEIHPVKIIWRGVCEHYDAGSLLAFFSPLRARYIVATEVFPIHYQTLGPFLRRVGVAPLLNGTTTFEQALRSDDTHALDIAHTLYVLIVTEMIRAQSLQGAAAVFPDAPATQRSTKPVDYRELTQACEEVARTYLALKERDYFTMLDLSRQASETEVSLAYDRLAKPFMVENLLPGLPEDVVRRAREIDGLLRRARDTLSSPEERRRYVTRLEDTPPPPPIDALAS